MKSVAFLTITFLTIGCAVGPRRISPTPIGALAVYEFHGTNDAVFDAIWLALEQQKFVVTQPERITARLEATHERERCSIDVSPHGDVQRVTIESADTLEEPIARVAESAQHMLDTWKALSDLTFDARRSEISVPGLSVLVPRVWERFDFSASRRRVTVQKLKKVRGALNPTVLIDFGRRKPVPVVSAVLRDTARAALGNHRLELSTTSPRIDGEAFTLNLIDEGATLTLTARLLFGQSDSTTVTIAAVCANDDEPTLSCDAEWTTLIRSLVTKGISFPRAL